MARRGAADDVEEHAHRAVPHPDVRLGEEERDGVDGAHAEQHGEAEGDERVAAVVVATASTAHCIVTSDSSSVTSAMVPGVSGIVAPSGSQGVPSASGGSTGLER